MQHLLNIDLLILGCLQGTVHSVYTVLRIVNISSYSPQLIIIYDSIVIQQSFLSL